MAMNHMVSDAAGFKDYLYFVCEAYSKLLLDPLWAPGAPRAERRDLGLVLDSVSPLARIGGFFGRGGGSNHAGKISFPLAEGGEAEPFIATRTIDREKVDGLKSLLPRERAPRSTTQPSPPIAASSRGASARGRLGGSRSRSWWTCAGT